jgi:inward rectifier potassium channel
VNENVKPPYKPHQAPRYSRYVATGRARRAVIKGQDSGRWTDFYHLILNAPWWMFFVELAVVFALLNAIFAWLYMMDASGAKPSSYWDSYLFSVQTLGSMNYTSFTPRTTYANIIVSIEAFFGILIIAFSSGIIFARFARPSARVVFSKVATIVPYDGVPTLMFRAANQRGNQIFDASVYVSLARQGVSAEGMAMRRFDELRLVRSRSPLFALSWTVMHRIDETSPLHGQSIDSLLDMQAEIVVLLSGRDETVADIIYARHSYLPDEIRWHERFVDVLSITNEGRRVVNLRRFHDTEPF